MDTQNSPEAQAPTEGDAQLSVGQVITGSIVLDEAQQLAVYRAARESIDRLPNVSWADKGFLGALVGRLDFTKGVARDGHEWLARWFNTSLSAVRRRRDALAKAGYIHDRECRVDGGNLTNEIALPIVAQVALARGDARFRTPPGCSISGTNEVGVLSDRYGDLGEGIGEARRQGASALADASHEGDLKKSVHAPIEVLSHWRACKFFRERVPSFAGVPEQFVDLDEWRQWLAYYGDAPEHLKTPAAHRQVLEIAAELKTSVNATGHLIVTALAYWVCKAHRDGKRISSLGFIATALARRAADGDFAWLFDVPPKIDAREFENASAFARETATILRGWKLPMWEHELTSTMRVEELAGLLKKHTRAGVVAGINRATAQLKETGSLEPHLTGNEVVIGWGWFTPYIEAARDEHREREATRGRRMMTDAEMRAMGTAAGDRSGEPGGHARDSSSRH